MGNSSTVSELKAVMSIKRFRQDLDRNLVKLVEAESKLKQLNNKAMDVTFQNSAASSISTWKAKLVKINETLESIKRILTDGKQKIDSKDRSEGVTFEQFDLLINQQAGMLGISESSSDMRELLALEDSDSRAAEAIAMFCYQTKNWIGSYVAALDGLETLVFSGGIGENCNSIRSRICRGRSFLGIKIDDSLNSQQAAIISLPDCRVTVRVIKTDEELLMAQSVNQLLE